MNAIIEYFKANPLFFWIIVVCVAVVLILIIVAIAKAAHKSKQKAAKLEADSDLTTSAEPDSSSAKKTLPDDAKQEPETQTSETSAPAATSAPVETNEKVETSVSLEEEPLHDEASDDKLSNEQSNRADTTSSVNEESEPKAAFVYADQSHMASRPAAEKLIEKTADEEDKKSVYTGKWVILKNEDNTYYFELRASNGEKLLTSIDYTSLSGAKNGIKTHKNNILRDNIVISQNKKKQYFFKLLNGSKQLLCTGETYPTKARCESAVDSVKRFAESAVVTVKKDEDDSEE